MMNAINIMRISKMWNTQDTKMSIKNDYYLFHFSTSYSTNDLS